MQELEQALKKTIYQALGFSFFVGLMTMAVPFNMLLIFMWAIPSESVSNILTIASAAMAGLVFMAVFDVLRFALFRRFAVHLENTLGDKILIGMFKNSAELEKGEASSAMNDLRKVRGFLNSPMATSFLDALLTPLQLLIIFIISPLLGSLATLCILVIVLIKLISHRPTKERLQKANSLFGRANSFAEDCVYNAQSVRAMGMQAALAQRWRAMQDEMIGQQTVSSEKAGMMSGATKALGLIMQALMFGTGTYLMIVGDLSPGLMLVAVIIAGRVVQPLQMLVNSGAEFQDAMDAFKRIKEFFAAQPPQQETLDLPPPQGKLKADKLLFAVNRKPLLSNVSFELEPGGILGVIGPSGAGKSTLARLLTGVWRPAGGTLRLDGADMHSWDQDKLGPYIGYLPQDVELFAGTVATNISRFKADGTDLAAVKEAAQMAGLSELIGKLPHGYDTLLEEQGRNLPGGLRQRIGLARALYGSPRLVILDEPDASLDQEGVAALENILAELKKRQATVVLITHRTSLLKVTDQLLLLVAGQPTAYGPTGEVLQKLGAGRGTPPVSSPGSSGATVTVANPALAGAGTR